MNIKLLVLAFVSLLAAPTVFAHGDEKQETSAKEAVGAVERFSAALSAGDLEKAGTELDPGVAILESGGVKRCRDEHLGGHAKSDAAFLKSAMTTLQAPQGVGNG